MTMSEAIKEAILHKVTSMVDDTGYDFYESYESYLPIDDEPIEPQYIVTAIMQDPMWPDLVQGLRLLFLEAQEIAEERTEEYNRDDEEDDDGEDISDLED